jgi:RimJ/RimL family protein N-acetyltransferase
MIGSCANVLPFRTFALILPHLDWVPYQNFKHIAKKVETLMSNLSSKILMPEHAEVWQALRLEGVRDFPLGFLVTLEEAASASPDRCREILGSRNIRGVFEGEKLVGFCGYRQQELTRVRHRGDIGPFFVTQSHQGSGAAKVLMAGVIKEAKDSGVSQLELFVDTENQRAIAFYKRQGFELVATHPDSIRIDGQSQNDYFLTLRI